MAATLTGIVFNDLNNNGTFDPGEPGIPNVFLTLYNAATSTCLQTITDSNGNYSFTVTTAGTYRVYETVSSAVTCPPTVFTQPDGFLLSNGPRVLSNAVTQAQINNNATIGNINFSHSANSGELTCSTTMIQFVNTPTQWFNIDVATGVPTFQGLLNPANNVNAIGYNILDNYIYGYDQTTHKIARIDEDRNITELSPNPPGLPSNDFNVGTFDKSGHLFLFVNNTSRFYTVDLNQASATFMKLVDPTNGYIEQTSNFGTALTQTINVSDWAYNPLDGFLYGVESVGNTSRVMRVNPTNGTAIALTTSAPVLNPTGRSWGAVAMDAAGEMFAIYNGDGGIFRYTITGLTASATRISTTFTTSFNDATMCPNALIGQIADIAVTKNATPNPVNVGDVLTYNLLISNFGPDSADNVTLTDTVPPELGNVEYSINGGITFLPWTGNVNLGTFAAGATLNVIIRGTVLNGGTGIISNTAIVGSSADDPNPDNNTSTADVDVEGLADMAITKTALPNPATPNGQITFTLTVENLGPSDAENVVITDAIPPQVTGAEYSLNGGITFFPWTGSLNLGTFPANTTQTILIRGTVSPSTVLPFTNTAIVSSTTPDPNPENNTSTVLVLIEESADMAITKTASPNPITPGSVITFTLTVNNFGPSDADNVVITDVIPPQVTGAEFSIDGGITFFPWTGSLNLNTFPANTTQTILIRGTVSAAFSGIFFNTATVSSTTPDPDPDNNTSTVEVIVGSNADLSIVKTASSSTVKPSDVLMYTLLISNAGPDDAENVVLTDVVPASLLGAQYSTDGGVTFLPWTGSLNLGTVAANTSLTVLIKGTVSATAIGAISNTAVVESTTPDPDPDNNTSTVVVFVCNERCQAISDLFESVALEQTALSHILNAEGEKLQSIIAMPNLTTNMLLDANNSVRSMVNSISMLETILSGKLALFSQCPCGTETQDTDN